MRRVVLLLLTAPLLAQSTLWKDLAVLDCTGGFHVLPGTSLETDVNLGSLLTGLNVLVDGITSRATCACPDISSREIQERFVPSVPSLLRYLEGANKVRDAGSGPRARPCARLRGRQWGLGCDSLWCGCGVTTGRATPVHHVQAPLHDRTGTIRGCRRSWVACWAPLTCLCGSTCPRRAVWRSGACSGGTPVLVVCLATPPPTLIRSRLPLLCYKRI